MQFCGLQQSLMETLRNLSLLAANVEKGEEKNEAVLHFATKELKIDFCMHSIGGNLRSSFTHVPPITRFQSVEKKNKNQSSINCKTLRTNCKMNGDKYET